MPSSSHQVRPFRRSDRDQLADLVNAHAAAVVPGLGVSVSALLSQLDRQPDEYVLDPWVSERLTLVAEDRERVVAATHLIRYAGDERVGPDYRNAGEIRWLVFWPAADAAASDLMAAALALFRRWGVGQQLAEGDLPVPGVFGVPEQWPHVRELYERAGFVPDGHTEIVFLADVADLRRPLAPLPGLTVRRSVGSSGTRLTAVRAEETAGFIEVEVLQETARQARNAGWADVGNLWVAAEHRRHGVATWLLGQAANWLYLARVDRLLDYTYLDGRDATGQNYDEQRAFLRAMPFTELTRTQRGWTRSAPP